MIEYSHRCWDCGVRVGDPHGQADYGRCDGYEISEVAGIKTFYRTISGDTPSRREHRHEWQPAGVLEAGDGRFALVFGMCKCSEITIRQWDY